MFRARTAQNVAIVVGLNWVNQFVQIATKVVLARLILPDDFGIFALAIGLVSLVSTFGNFGLSYAIIQAGDGATKEDYDVGMTLRILISVLLLGATIGLAGPWASLYPLFPTPLVTQTTQILAALYLITPWSFVPSTRLTAELRYRAQLLPNLVGQFGYAAFAIAFAFLGFGVWALIYGTILGQLATVVGFTMAAPWRFRLSLRTPVARRLIAYAQHLLSASLLAFLLVNIDDFAVGFFRGATSLGLYAVASGLGAIPWSLISSPAGTALFPSLAKIQKDLVALRDGYLESFGYAVAIIAPASLGIAVTAPEIVRIVLGPTWIPATAALVILALYGLARALMDYSTSLFSAVGRPRIVAELNLYLLLMSLVPLFPLTFFYGIEGAALAMTVPVAIVFFLSVRQISRVLGCSQRSVLQRGVTPFVAAEAMGTVVFFVKYAMYATLPARIFLPFGGLSMAAATAVILVTLPLGIIMYTGLVRILDRRLFDGFWRLVTMAIRPGMSQVLQNGQ